MQWLAKRVASGVRIGDAVESLRAIDASDGPLLRAALDRDTKTISEILDRILRALPLEDALELGIFPVMRELGDLWAAGKAPVISERIMSEAVVRKLTPRLAPARTVGPQAIVFCPRAERHEVGALALSVFLAEDQWDVTFLGADISAVDAALLATETTRALIAVSTLKETAQEVATSVVKLPGRTQLILSGPGAQYLAGTGPVVWGPRLRDARASAVELARL